MSEPFLGQIEFFAFGYAPRGWSLCAGQTLPINQYQALFAVLGTTYGGNGTTTFMLPDLRSRLAVGQGGNGWVLGQTQGEENHTLLVTETPVHTHTLAAVAGNASGSTSDAPGPGVPAVAVLRESQGYDLDRQHLCGCIDGPPAERADGDE